METDIIHLEIPADHKYLNLVSACIIGILERVEGLAESAIVSYNLQLAVQEACTNIVKHAYAGQPEGRIETVFTLQQSPRRLIIDLYDTGHPFDPSDVPKPSLSNPQIHGYGLFLMNQLLDEVIYNPEPDKNHWRLVKNL